MNIQAVRRVVMDLYPNATWHRKVHNMPDRQVYAIYRSVEENRKHLDEMEAEAIVINTPEPFHQIDIWECLNDKGGTH